MEPEEKSAEPDFTLPATDRVNEINEIAFRDHAKRWAYTNAFFPVVRAIEKGKIFLTLYYDSYRNSSTRHIEELCATYYREEFPDIAYSECNIVKMWLEKEVSQEDIMNCNSMIELESVHVKAVNKERYDEYIPYKGGLTIYTLYLDWSFKRWNNLISKGFLEPWYEEEFQRRLLDAYCGVKTKEETIFPPEEKDKFSVSIHIFQKTGGDQPTSLDPKAINKFFKGNIAKDWAMRMGYIATFTGFENDEIRFDIISDPRFKGSDLMIAKQIAGVYAENINLLKNATRYQANHYKANDIIGFLINKEDEHLVKGLWERIDKAYAELSEKPQLVHYGTVVK